MKIMVEVPDGEYCSGCTFRNSKSCVCFHFILNFNGDKWAYKKCPACLEACKSDLDNENHIDFVEKQIKKWPEWKKDVAKRVLANEKVCEESVENDD